MDLTKIVTAIQERLGVPAGDAMFTTPVCTDLANSALHMIEMDGDWPWLEDTETIVPSGGTSVYAPNSNWTRTIEVQWGDYPPLQKVDIADLRALGTPAGRPQFYAVFSEHLHLRPVPAGSSPTITHLYLRTEPDLVDGTDLPLMPAQFHYAIVELAAYLAYRRIHQLPEAGGAQAAYQEWINRMLARINRVSNDQGGGIAHDTPAPAAAPGP